MQDILPEKVISQKRKLGFPAPENRWAVELIKLKREEITQWVKSLNEFINADEFQNLMDRIIKKIQITDILLFWRVIFLAKWYSYQLLKQNQAI